MSGLRERNFILSDGDDRFFTARNQFVGKDYFNIFSFDLVMGDKRPGAGR